MRRRALLLAALALAGCQSIAGPGAVPLAARAQAAAGTPLVRGRAFYLERMLPPPDATLDVQLIDDGAMDGTDGGDGTVVARMRWTGLPGPPFAFELPYDPARVHAGRRYALRATLRDAHGHLAFSTERRVEVVPGAKEPVELRLRRPGDPGTILPPR